MRWNGEIKGSGYGAVSDGDPDKLIMISDDLSNVSDGGGADGEIGMTMDLVVMVIGGRMVVPGCNAGWWWRSWNGRPGDPARTEWSEVMGGW